MHELALTQDLVESDRRTLRRSTGHPRRAGGRQAVGRGARCISLLLRAVRRRARLPKAPSSRSWNSPGRARCRDCEQRDSTLDSIFDRCPCGSLSLELLSGEQLQLREVEVQ